jgi:hypothetical protein
MGEQGSRHHTATHTAHKAQTHHLLYKGTREHFVTRGKVVSSALF